MRVDRRVRRPNPTNTGELPPAIQVMAEDGVAALSLAEVARRMGMRPPSLYQYFPSKLAVYDALFERGARQTLAVEEAYQSRLAENPLEGLAAAQAAWNDWVMANPVLAQLLYWRPVPGFEPYPKAYQPALQLQDLGRAALQAAVDAGQLRRCRAPSAATTGRGRPTAPSGTCAPWSPTWSPSAKTASTWPRWRAASCWADAATPTRALWMPTWRSAWTTTA